LDTTEVIKAESEEVLNTLAEHDFQDVQYLKMAGVLGTVHTSRKGHLGRRWRPAGRNLVIDQMAAPYPEIMDGSLYY
jgi:hypothetical protein